MIFVLLESVTWRTVFSPLFTDINANELVNDNGVLRTNYCHMDCVQRTLSESTGDFLLFESLQITSSTTNSLRYWTYFMALHLLGHTTKWSMREYPSLTPDRSHLQRLRVSVLFPNTHQDRDTSCLASLPSSFILWAIVIPASEQPAHLGLSQLAVEIFSLSSPRDRKWVIISGRASSSCCESSTSSLSLTMQTDLVLDFFFCVGVTVTGMSYSGSAAVWVVTAPVDLLSSSSPKGSV